MVSVLIFIAVVGVCALMIWAAYLVEPHWVSKDGQRLVCYVQSMSIHGEPEGRFREVRVAKVNDSLVEVRQKGRMGRDHSSRNAMAMSLIKKRHRQGTYWNVVAVSPEPPKGKAIYLLGGNHDEGQPPLLALRIPSKSRAVPMLDQAFADRPTL